MGGGGSATATAKAADKAARAAEVMKEERTDKAVEAAMGTMKAATGPRVARADEGRRGDCIGDEGGANDAEGGAGVHHGGERRKLLSS
jgi:hypothetical protein